MNRHTYSCTNGQIIDSFIIISSYTLDIRCFGEPELLLSKLKEK